MQQQYDMNLDGDNHSDASTGPLILKSVKDAEDKLNFDSRIRDKFRGCLVGALVGDCIGTLFECDYSVSFSILGDLYVSLTNLSEDEKLMDLHGIDFSLGPKLAQELLERKNGQRASVMPDMESITPMGSLESASAKTPKRHSSFDKRRGSFSRPIERFSDDTVMTRSVVTSLIRMKGFDVKDMARQLTEDCFLNRTRKFGGFNRDIFTQLRETGYGDPFGPARKASGNMGSLGNEGATRVASVALIGWNSDPGNVVDMASKLSKITNYHKSAVIGAVWQAVAIHAAFNWDLQTPEALTPTGTLRSRLVPNLSPMQSRNLRKNQENIPLTNKYSKEFDYRTFCKNILDGISKVESRASSLMENLKSLVHPNRETLKLGGESAYSEKIETILEFMERTDPPQRSEVVEKLGNGTKALESVPIALYAFIMAASTSKFPELPVQIKSPVLRSIFYAISFGGDSDTISSMAGAIAGAYWGYDKIPQEILRVCEGSRETVKLADDLFNNFQ